ncbi:GNAT family N-acetyltransferase [bacterium]|nr:GNAT family N-acetyltransferase [bacterium]
MEHLPVFMVRDSLDDVPQFDLPAPFAVRRYRPGDAATWLRIQKAADHYSTFHREKFAEQFGTDDGVLAERQLFLCDGEGSAVGTVTAWFADHRGVPHGRIHWVAIVPDIQGRGLARPMLGAACNRLRELGHPRAFLDSQTMRVPALNLYLKFGFRPDIRHDDDLRAWRLVGPHLKPAYWQWACSRVSELA